MITLNSVSSCLFANPLCPKSIFWTNLMLLGFNPSAHVSYSTIVFDKDVFAKGPSSVKAMELIIWFLFNELDSTLTKDVCNFVRLWKITEFAYTFIRTLYLEIYWLLASYYSCKFRKISQHCLQVVGTIEKGGVFRVHRHYIKTKCVWWVPRWKVNPWRY